MSKIHDKKKILYKIDDRAEIEIYWFIGNIEYIIFSNEFSNKILILSHSYLVSFIKFLNFTFYC